MSMHRRDVAAHVLQHVLLHALSCVAHHATRIVVRVVQGHVKIHASTKPAPSHVVDARLVALHSVTDVQVHVSEWQKPDQMLVRTALPNVVVAV